MKRLATLCLIRGWLKPNHPHYRAMRTPLIFSAQKGGKKGVKPEPGPRWQADPSPCPLSDGDSLINANQTKGFFSTAINTDKFLLAWALGDVPMWRSQLSHFRMAVPEDGVGQNTRIFQ